MGWSVGRSGVLKYLKSDYTCPLGRTQVDCTVSTVWLYPPDHAFFLRSAILTDCIVYRFIYFCSLRFSVYPLLTAIIWSRSQIPPSIRGTALSYTTPFSALRQSPGIFLIFHFVVHRPGYIQDRQFFLFFVFTSNCHLSNLIFLLGWNGRSRYWNFCIFFFFFVGQTRI